MRAVVSALWVLTTASCAHSAASITWLPPLSGDSFVYNITGVSGDGTVIVGNDGFIPYEGADKFRGVRWRPASGSWPAGPGGIEGIALGGYDIPDSTLTGVSGDGSVIIGEGAFWTAGSGWVSLAGLPGGNGDSFAGGVSADGSVIVGGSWSTSGFQAYRWTAGSGMVGLGYLPGSTNSSANGISADGSVVVGTSSYGSVGQAFRWTAGSGMVGLGYLPGSTNSSASGVSGDGSIVVGTSYTASGEQAFRWTAGSGMVGLGYLPGTTNSFATGVSGDGSVIVGTSSPYFVDGNSSPYFYSYSYRQAQGFHWTAGSGMQSLWDVLETNGLNLDYVLELTPSGISADGNTIVGYDDTDGGEFVATLPGLIGVSPVLGINSWSSTAHQLVLSWNTNYAGFTLQSSTGPGSTNWTDCASPAILGTSFVVTNAMSAGAQFFRLKR
jgi:probable HAF family extracellular repeat protein